MAVLAAVAVAASLPLAYRERMAVCSGAPCPPDIPTQAEVDKLADLGLTHGGYVVAGLTLTAILAAAYLGIALLLLRLAGRRADALYAAGVLVAVGVVFVQTLPALVTAWPAGQVLLTVVEILAMAGFLGWLLTFPDGRFAPRWSVAVVLLVAADMTASTFGARRSDEVEAVLMAALAAVVIGLLAYCYRRLDTVEHQRARWVAGSFAVAVLALALAAVAQQGLGVRPGTVADLAVQVGIVAAFLLVPLAVAAATLRRGLFDVGSAVARAATYAILSAGAIGAHLLLVAAAAALSIDRTGAAAVASALVAVAVLPAYRFVRRATNRALYGMRDDPALLLASLASATGEAPSPAGPTPLASAAFTIARAMRLPYVAIAVDGLAEVQVGQSSAGWPTETFPLIDDSEEIGCLRVGARDRDGVLDPTDRRALAPVIGHLAVLARAAALAERLRQSHLELVGAREEERRRLRNDLHDGLGPALGAVRLTLTAARNHLDRAGPHADSGPGAPAAEPDSALAAARSRELVDSARSQVADAIADVRRLIYGLRPPALDELGLVGALRAFVRGLPTDRVRVAVVGPASLVLPAAVEVAAFRIGLEAVTNAVRHSTGCACTVTVEVDDVACVIEVHDDGRGTVDGAPVGVGITSMRERAAEVGGSVQIVSGPSGTTVRAALPLIGGSA